eukprot:TRINITY_DN1705_c0_g1::TRINITY_DN1705_c0_g1_i1::g.25053::m.25053 TRINITY_DN1705_c0_g1::TRINITY_DN1705_c0_g1_i1::g.25053  ORF type:complete len:150 (+),score=43.82,sp/Q5RE33/REEP5_PONAB/42.03/2e-29,TB2_DP1_HVA22/PF03134.14/1.1e-29 TRINITY_DN1705_c0_g1_i1:63-512(+)
MLPVWFASFACYVIGFVWPAYASFKAIESEGGDDDKQWLTYWVCYAVFTVLELVEFFVAWFPFYYEVKLVALFYLSYPALRGAEKVYNTVIRPFMQQHEQKIDQIGSAVASQAGNMSNLVGDKAEKAIFDTLNAGAQNVKSTVDGVTSQ